MSRLKCFFKNKYDFMSRYDDKQYITRTGQISRWKIKVARVGNNTGSFRLDQLLGYDKCCLLRL